MGVFSPPYSGGGPKYNMNEWRISCDKDSIQGHFNHYTIVQAVEENLLCLSQADQGEACHLKSRNIVDNRQSC